MGDFKMKVRFTLYWHTDSARNIAIRILSTRLSPVENKAAKVEHLLQRLVNFFDQNFPTPFYREGCLPVRAPGMVGGGRDF
jgi:hypothetical protein